MLKYSNITALLPLLFAPLLNAQVVISEYILGASSSISALELTNTGSSEVSFSDNDRLVRNGSEKFVSLSGQRIPAGGSLVIVSGNSTLLNSLNDDVLPLSSPKLQIKKNEYWSLRLGGQIIDTVGPLLAVHGYRRAASSIADGSFDASQWTQFPATDYSDLGGTSTTAVIPDCSLTGIGTVQNNTRTIFVSTQGEDCANGSQDFPFAHVADAKQGIRSLKNQGALTEPVIVNIAAGNYQLSQTLQFNSQDSGTAAFPVTYQGNGQVILSGALSLQPHITDVVNNTFTDSLVDQSVVGQLKQVDLSVLNLPSSVFELPKMHGYGLTQGRNRGPIMVYQGEQRLHLARWPNETDKLDEYLAPLSTDDYPGNVSYKTVIDRGAQSAFKNDPNYVSKNSSEFATGGGTFSVDYGNRISKWQTPSEIFMDGVVGRAWEWTYNRLANIEGNKITLTRGEISGVYDKKPAHFYFDNVAQELDQPGEFYLDRATKVLYFYPLTSDLSNLSIATSADNLISLSGAQYLKFQGLTLEGTRGHGVVVSNSQQVNFERMVLRNITMNAITLNGSNNTISDSTIYNIGGVGATLDGGQYTQVNGSNLNYKVTQKANNIARGNTLYGFAWDQKSQVPGISLRGIGNSAVENEIYDAPHFAIMLRDSAENTVKHNYIHDLPSYFKQDGGAIYFGIGHSPHLRGNVVEANYLENIPTNGVYIDNFSSGVSVKNNIFNNVANQKSNFAAIDVNGGGQNMMTDNLFYNVARPIKANRFAERNLFNNYYSSMVNVQDAFNAFGVTNTDHKDYPNFQLFLDYSDDSDFQYQISTAKNNVSYNQSTHPYDSKAKDTGVVMPDDGRWINQNNTIITMNNPTLSDQWQQLSSFFYNTDGQWLVNLKQHTESLSATLVEWNTLYVNGDSGVDNNTDTDSTDTDNTGTNSTDTDNTNTDSTDTDNTDTDSTDTDNTDTDNTGTDNTDTDSTDTDNTDTDNTGNSSATDAGNTSQVTSSDSGGGTLGGTVLLLVVLSVRRRLRV